MNDNNILWNHRVAEDLAAKALEMMKAAYAPYSHFQVGAAVLASSGKVYGGANVENASYGATVCAERNAIARAVNDGERRLLAIAIAGGRDGLVKDFCYPCGICRQVMREFADPKELIVMAVRSKSLYRIHWLSDLLPESFGPESLNGSVRLP